MGEELDLPDEVYGFGSWLLWLLATRATDAVDRAFAAGPARPSRHYGMVDGHPVPTPSLVAWLLTAAERGVPLERLAQHGHSVGERQKVLRTIVSRAIGGEPHLFKDIWLHELAAVCGLGEPELQLLLRSRDDEGYPVEPEALRKAITRAFRSGTAVGQRRAGAAGAGQVVVVGEIPREPPGFVARDLLGRLAGAAAGGPAAVVCAVTGLRGVGKTHLAAAYARARVADRWGLVGWVNAETQGTLLADLARIADRLGIADPDGDSAESARRLREHLQAHAQPGLLVLDNATSPEQLRPLLPATGGTQVVITSTDQAFAELGEPVKVAEFTRAESVGFLRARTGLADPVGADAVAGELGDLPLALAQAAATIRRQHLSCQQYLERLGKVPAAALLGSVPGGDYPHPAAAALLLSIQATEASDPSGLASRLLRVMAALSPDGVGRSLLDGLADPDGRTELDPAVERCVAGSLLSWSVSGDAVIMHRLLGRALRERDQAEGRWTETVTAALNLLEPALIAEEQAFARREEGAALVAQIEALWEVAVTAATADPDLGPRLLHARSWAVRQLREAADVGRAIEMGERLLVDCQDLLGRDHPDTLAAADNLAWAYQRMLRLEQAIALYEQTMGRRERLFGAKNPDTFRSRLQLAVTYTYAGRFDEAIALLQPTVDDREHVLGLEHPDTLTSQEYLAYTYRSAGRLGEAIPLYEQTVAGRERVLGAEHPDTLNARHDLAIAYRDAGRPGEAIALLERTLPARERVLGADHPDTLKSLGNLARAYRDAGRAQEAVPLHERAVAQQERVLGTDHPDTLTERNNLAVTYIAAGRLDQAIALLERTLADRRRVLGDANPHTLISRINLGRAYGSADRLPEAIQLHERTLADCERVLGLDHPYTLAARHHLADAYATAGRLEHAIPLLEQVVADRERILGISNPQTLTSRNRLAQCYQQTAQLE